MTRSALIIANTQYTDPGLAQLSAPGRDAEDFARVLKSGDIAAFDEVTVLLNESQSTVSEAIDNFYSLKKPDDLLLLYFSGHGVRDEFGSLFLAVKNTNRGRLRSTAIKSDYIREAMDQSRSRRQVLVLDCCNSGAFAQGTKAALGVSIGTSTAFEGSGYGRVVLTASDATQFAWEGDKIIGETQTQNSLFTHFLVRGLEGEADRDGDGTISVDELYDYAYEQIVNLTPAQTPGKWSYKQQGEIILRQSTAPAVGRMAPLPPELIASIESPYASLRESAVQQLQKLLAGKNPGLALSARHALEQIASSDDSRRVANLATQALEPIQRAEQEVAEKAALQAAANLETEKAEKEKAEREAAEKAARELADRQAAEKAAREAADREAAQKAALELVERQAAEKAARDAADREAAKKAALELAERQAAERTAIETARREQAERQAAAKAEKEKTDRETAEKKARDLASHQQPAPVVSPKTPGGEVAQDTRGITRQPAAEPAVQEVVFRHPDAVIKQKPTTEIQKRRLEAAIEKEITVGRAAQLFVLVSSIESGGILSVVAKIDEEISLDESSLQSRDIILEFPVRDDKVLPIGLTVRLTAPDFSIPVNMLNVLVPPEGDSEVATFMITPNKTGRLLISIEILKDQQNLATKSIRTTAVEHEPAARAFLLFKMPVEVLVQNNPSNRPEDGKIGSGVHGPVESSPVQVQRNSLEQQNINKIGSSGSQPRQSITGESIPRPIPAGQPDLRPQPTPQLRPPAARTAGRTILARLLLAGAVLLSLICVLAVYFIYKGSQFVINELSTPAAPVQFVGVGTQPAPTPTGSKPSQIRIVIFSPDGRSLAASSLWGGTQIWDVGSSALIKSLSNNGMHLTYAPGGSLLAADNGSLHEIEIFDVAGGALQKTLKGHANTINDLVFSPDGKALASSSNDKTVRLWHVDDGSLLFTFQSGSEGAFGLAFSPDGRLLAAASVTKILIWNVADGSLRNTLEAENVIWNLAFSPDGKILASAGDGGLLTWRVADGILLNTSSTFKSNMKIFFSPGDNSIVLAAEDGLIYQVDPANGEVMNKLDGITPSIVSLSLSPDGKTVAYAAGDDVIRLWQLVPASAGTAQPATTEPGVVNTSTPANTLTPRATSAPQGYDPYPMPDDVFDPKGVPMRLVPGGSFTMGSDTAGVEEKPPHIVVLTAYLIDKFEVTNKFYAACMEAKICKIPEQDKPIPHPNYYTDPQYANHPVINVTWDMAKTYCDWRGARLPTEAEWEKAARGTDTRPYPWGDEQPGNALANFNNNRNDISDVGSYEMGQSPYGVFDMAGNVWEWTADWFQSDYYATLPANSANPPGPASGTSRVARGGSWDFTAPYLHLTYRAVMSPKDKGYNVGIRCVVSTP